LGAKGLRSHAKFLPRYLYICYIERFIFHTISESPGTAVPLYNSTGRLNILSTLSSLLVSTQDPSGDLRETNDMLSTFCKLLYYFICHKIVHNSQVYVLHLKTTKRGNLQCTGTHKKVTSHTGHKGPTRPELNPVSEVGSSYSPTLDGMLVHCRLTPTSMSSVPILYTWVKSCKICGDTKVQL